MWNASRSCELCYQVVILGSRNGLSQSSGRCRARFRRVSIPPAMTLFVVTMSIQQILPFGGLMIRCLSVFTLWHPHFRHCYPFLTQATESDCEYGKGSAWRHCPYFGKLFELGISVEDVHSHASLVYCSASSAVRMCSEANKTRSRPSSHEVVALSMRPGI